MKLSRKWILVAALVVSVAMATSGTLAYLTDRDSEVNVFTFGNVDIELNEEFEQGTTLLPGKDIEKEPTITNKGKSDAWVWATIAIPAELDNDDASQNVIHFNMSSASVAEGQWSWWTEDDTNRTNWLKEYDVDVLGNGAKYNVFTVLYTSPLKAGETTTTPVMYKVYMDPHIDIDPDGNLHHVEGGVVTDIDWNINDNGTPSILLAAYAIQVEGFDTVYDAYDAYATQWGENGGVEYESNVTVIEKTTDSQASKAAITNALREYAAEGATEVYINAQGSSVDGYYMLTKDMIPEGTTVTISNAHFVGTQYGNQVDGTVIFEDCFFESDNQSYAIHFDAGKGNIIFNNCTLKGWSSFGATIDSVEMNNCTVIGDGESSTVRFYQDAVMNKCFVDSINDVNTTDSYFDGISAVDCTVVINDCSQIYADLEVANAKIIDENRLILAKGEDNVFTYFDNGDGKVWPMYPYEYDE